MADNRQFRFGIFDLDADTLELRKAQRPVRLRPQSLKLLRLLVSRPRQLISRDEIHKELWGADVFVDFEQGVNHSVKQLRAALGDDADAPRYIETLPRRGYRFIAPVELFTEVEEPACLPSTNGHRRSFSRLQSSTEYVATQVARHKAGTALIACALAVIVGGTWWAVSSPWFAPHHTRSVAVLPFSTIGEADQYFADGITEAVTTELGRVGGLRVIASNSTFAYRDKTAFRKIARELGVGLVVRGSVQRAGGKLRIDVSLVDTRDETALWSERFYGRELTDVLTVQDDISRQIATPSQRRSAPHQRRSRRTPPQQIPDAYDAYLRGVWHLKGRSATTPIGATRGTRLVAAIEELERAVAHDRNFALARAALASVYTQRFFYFASDPVFEQKAFLEIQRALAINPEQAEAYLARAQLTWNLRNGFPHERAITDLRRALSINPNLADAYVELGKVYYHIGLTDKAVDADEQAQHLDPGAPVPGG